MSGRQSPFQKGFTITHAKEKSSIKGKEQATNKIHKELMPGMSSKSQILTTTSKEKVSTPLTR